MQHTQQMRASAGTGRAALKPSAPAALHSARAGGRKLQPCRFKEAGVEAPAAADGKKTATTRVRLGDSDLLVSRGVLGTMTWGGQNNEQEAHEQLSYAWDLGINMLDTAEMYPFPPSKEIVGSTDRIIGSWVKQAGIRREELVVATKVCGYNTAFSWIRDPPEPLRVTRKQIQQSVDASLQRLQLDHVDLLHIHWPDRYIGGMFGQPAYDIAKEHEFTPFEEQLEGMQDVIRAGKVRYIGVSNETSYGVSEFCRVAREAGLPKIQTIENKYSLLDRVAFETDLAETCRWNNVSLLVNSPLSGGLLTGKYASDSKPEGTRYTQWDGYVERYAKSASRQATLEYMRIAEKYGLTPSQLALAWVNSRWFVTCVLLGATKMAHLKDNIKALDIELPQEAIDDVNAVYRRYRDPSARD